MKKKILILGSSGTLGRCLFNNLKKKNKYIVLHNGLIRRKFDLSYQFQIAKLLNKTKPDLIINCSAIINIDYCERYKKKSKKINVETLNHIFFLKKKLNLDFKLIQISTDQMYNRSNCLASSEKSKTYILNEYTKQKIECENLCNKNKALILRLNYFAYEKNNLFYWIVNSIKKNKKVYFFKDVYFNPLSLTSLSNIISQIAKKKIQGKFDGVYNLGSKDFISKSEFAIYINKKLKKYRFNNYNVVLSNKFFKTNRPKNMRMNTNKFEKIFRIKLPYIKKELNTYIRKVC